MIYVHLSLFHLEEYCPHTWDFPDVHPKQLWGGMKDSAAKQLCAWSRQEQLGSDTVLPRASLILFSEPALLA